jgi:hypothetical protein
LTCSSEPTDRGAVLSAMVISWERRIKQSDRFVRGGCVRREAVYPCPLAAAEALAFDPSVELIAVRF